MRRNRLLVDSLLVLSQKFTLFKRYKILLLYSPVCTIIALTSISETHRLNDNLMAVCFVTRSFQWLAQ